MKVASAMGNPLPRPCRVIFKVQPCPKAAEVNCTGRFAWSETHGFMEVG